LIVLVTSFEQEVHMIVYVSCFLWHDYLSIWTALIICRKCIQFCVW